MKITSTACYVEFAVELDEEIALHIPLAASLYSSKESKEKARL